MPCRRKTGDEAQEEAVEEEQVSPSLRFPLHLPFPLVPDLRGSAWMAVSQVSGVALSGELRAVLFRIFQRRILSGVDGTLAAGHEHQIAGTPQENLLRVAASHADALAGAGAVPPAACRPPPRCPPTTSPSR